MMKINLNLVLQLSVDVYHAADVSVTGNAIKTVANPKKVDARHREQIVAALLESNDAKILCQSLVHPIAVKRTQYTVIIRMLLNGEQTDLQALNSSEA